LIAIFKQFRELNWLARIVSSGTDIIKSKDFEISLRNAEDPSLKRSANRSFIGDYVGAMLAKRSASGFIHFEAGRGATVVRPVKGKLNSPVIV
jgi:hypothetical protein